MRIIKDLTNTIFKPMQKDPNQQENPILENLLTPTLDDILLGHAQKFPLIRVDSVVDYLYLIAIKIQSPESSFQEMMDYVAVSSCKKKNEKIRKKKAEDAVKAYAPAFHKFNSSPTCLDQDANGKRIRETIGLSKDRNISRHFK